MATEAARLSEIAQQELAALGKGVATSFPARSQPVAVSLATGHAPVAEGEVLLLVLSAHAGLVTRRKVRGSQADLRELASWLASAEAAVAELPAPPSAAPPQLTSAEASMLDDAGFTEESSDAAGALERSAIELELFLRGSMSLEQAATALRVTTGRLRQRLSPEARTLYGVKVGGRWRIPRFQFAGKRALVRDIDQVLPHIRPEAHPLAVKTWFSSPHQDLVVGDDENAVTPLAWLSAGLPAAAVARLAEEI
jgi:hypothetical protein